MDRDDINSRRPRYVKFNSMAILLILATASLSSVHANLSFEDVEEFGGEIHFQNISLERRAFEENDILDGIEVVWEIHSDREELEEVYTFLEVYDNGGKLIEETGRGPFEVNESIESHALVHMADLSPGEYTLEMILEDEDEEVTDTETRHFELGKIVEFTGEFYYDEERGEDELIDQLMFKSEIDCLKDDDYIIRGIWRSGNTGEFKSLYEKVSLVQGLNEVSFWIDGERLYREKVDGEIFLEDLKIYRGALELEKTDSHYQTQEYHYTDFARPEIYFTGEFRSSPAEKNERGLYEKLSFEAEVNAQISIDYVTFNTHVYKEDGTYVTSLRGSHSLDVGTDWLSVELEGTKVSEMEYEGSFVHSGMSVEKFTTTFDEWREEYTTISYEYTDFAIPETELLSVESEGLDIGGTGLYDFLRITAEINMNEGGPYTIESTLKSRFGRTIDTVRMEKHLDERIQTVNVDFDGHKIYRFGGTDTSYRVDLEITPSDEQTPVIREENIRTDTYDHEQFERPDVQINKVVSDVARDTDGNGYYNELAFTLELEVGESGSYVIHSTLLDSQGYREVTSNTKETTLVSGTQQTVVTFSGRDIFRSRLDGYVLGYITVYKDEELVNEINLAHPTSVEYSWNEFHPLPAYIADCTAYIAPPTTEGEYGVLRLEVTVNATEERSETYDIQALVYTFDGYYIKEETVSQNLHKGSNNISVDIPGNIFTMKQRDGPYVVRRVRIIQGENTIDELDEVYTTEGYSYQDFTDIEIIQDDEPEESRSYGHLLPYVISLISISAAAAILVFYWKKVG